MQTNNLSNIIRGSKMIKRYDIGMIDLIQEKENGSWCRTEDVEKLEQQNKELIKAL